MDGEKRPATIGLSCARKSITRSWFTNRSDATPVWAAPNQGLCFAAQQDPLAFLWQMASVGEAEQGLIEQRPVAAVDPARRGDKRNLVSCFLLIRHSEEENGQIKKRPGYK
jgi:hypothetical protein